MIVPRTRLLFWVAALVVPFGALGVALPATGAIALAVIGLLALLAAYDAARAWDSLAGLRVELPAVVRLTKDRPGQLPVRFLNESQRARPVRLGVAFPASLEPASEDILTELPAGAAHAALTWPLTGRQRGSFSLRACQLETVSPFGFWARRASQPVATEVRVYPNLRTERRRLAALFLRRGNAGIHAHRQVGQGREFEKLRDYLPGDAVGDIHWKATAKRHRPATKVFQLERTQEVYVVVDSSRLSARLVPEVTPAESYLERFISAALVLGLVAERQGDLFGVVSFADRVQGFVRAQSGRAHYHACRDTLYGIQPQLVTPDYHDVATFLRLRLRRRALLLVLTNLDDPVLAESFTRSVEVLGRHHLVMVGMFRPPGAKPLFHGSAPADLAEVYQQLGGHEQWHNLRERERVLRRRGVGFRQLDHAELVPDLVTQYLNVKRRQLL